MGPFGVSILLFIGNSLFVAAEYGLLSAKRIKIQALADKGNRAAVKLLEAMRSRSSYVAGIQIGITLFSIAIGAVTEPALSAAIGSQLKGLPETVLSVISILVVSYPLVVLGELAPKYITLKEPERVALALIRPLAAWNLLVRPLIWLFEQSGRLILLPFRIDPRKSESEALSRDELSMIVQTGEEEGQFDETHASVVMKSLRLDLLKAGTVMVHRLDMQSLQVDLQGEDLIRALQKITHSRIPVYGSDLDDIRGVVYVQDFVKAWGQPDFRLEPFIKPAETVPESLTLDGALSRMRQRRTQILIVQDEYGGTAGMMTLEDIVEEVLGDLEDRLESEMPDILRISPDRIKLDPTVRWDELLEYMDLPIEEGTPTTTLAQMVIDQLQKVPVQGDSAMTDLGKVVVDQTTRKRMIQLSLYLEPKYRHLPDESI
jgi:CBS domain containing-hemolysin-like protein